MLPTFRTNRLIVRPRSITDLAGSIAMDDDPLVMRFIDVPWSDAASHRAFVAARITHRYPAGLGYWAVVAGAGAAGQQREAFLGWIPLTPLDLVGPETEIGWRFKRAVWGNGYASEAAAPVLAHAFDAVGLDEVVADINPANIASRRVAAKIGLRPAEAQIPPGGAWRHALARAAYLAARSAHRAAAR